MMADMFLFFVPLLNVLRCFEQKTKQHKHTVMQWKGGHFVFSSDFFFYASHNRKLFHFSSPHSSGIFSHVFNISVSFRFHTVNLLVIQLTDAIWCSSCSISYPGKFTWASLRCACTAANLTILCSAEFRCRVLSTAWTTSIAASYIFSFTAGTSCSLTTETNFVGLDNVVQAHFNFINHFVFSSSQLCVSIETNIVRDVRRLLVNDKSTSDERTTIRCGLYFPRCSQYGDYLRTTWQMVLPHALNRFEQTRFVFDF